MIDHATSIRLACLQEDCSANAALLIADEQSRQNVCAHPPGTPHQHWTSYQSPNSSDWLELNFGVQKNLGRVELLIDDDDDGGVKAPKTCGVQWLHGDSWENAVNTKYDL